MSGYVTNHADRQFVIQASTYGFFIALVLGQYGAYRADMRSLVGC